MKGYEKQAAARQRTGQTLTFDSRIVLYGPEVIKAYNAARLADHIRHDGCPHCPLDVGHPGECEVLPF